jgi:hypothetical protein
LLALAEEWEEDFPEEYIPSTTEDGGLDSGAVIAALFSFSSRGAPGAPGGADDSDVTFQARIESRRGRRGGGGRGRR